MRENWRAGGQVPKVDRALTLSPSSSCVCLPSYLPIRRHLREDDGAAAVSDQTHGAGEGGKEPRNEWERKCHIPRLARSLAHVYFTRWI